jgi:hypothetical protein
VWVKSRIGSVCLEFVEARAGARPGSRTPLAL